MVCGLSAKEVLHEEGSRPLSGRADPDRAALERGIAVMRKKSPKQFGLLVAEEDDATTHDVFIQYALFGEVVFA